MSKFNRATHSNQLCGWLYQVYIRMGDVVSGLTRSDQQLRRWLYYMLGVELINTYFVENIPCMARRDWRQWLDVVAKGVHVDEAGRREDQREHVAQGHGWGSNNYTKIDNN